MMTKSTKPIFERCNAWDEPEISKQIGIYPYFRAIEGNADAHVVVNGEEKVMIGSNNYLGLSNHPEVVEAAKEAVSKYGAGCTGSRFLNGNMDIHDALEEKLARFVNKEEAVVFTTGFLSTLGAIPALTGRHSVIFSDKENHACIAEACNLSFGQVVRYAHNDMVALERVLEKHRDVEEKIIVFDGVFSMTGNLVNLPEIVKLAEKYQAALYCDDAHALGVIGEGGRGTANHFGLGDETDIIMGTFSKSLASIGGFVAGSHKVVQWVKHHARSLIFSASMPPASVAAALKSLEVLEREPERLEKLQTITRMAREGFKSLGLRTIDNCSAIVPIILNGDRDFSFTLAQRLFEKGLFTTPIIPPAVPQGMTLIRTSYMASHTEEDIKFVLKIFAEVADEFNLTDEHKHEGELPAAMSR